MSRKTITTFDSNFWGTLDSIEKFYYLGFMIGDGGINGNTVVMDLSVRDYYWLKNYKENLGIDSPIKIRDQHPYRNSISASVRKTDKQWVTDLSEFGMVSCKTGHEHLPYEYCRNEKEIAALTLGIFDADGSACRVRGRSKYKINFLGNNHLIHQVTSMIESCVGIEPHAIVRDKNTQNIYYTNYCAKDEMIDLYKFLYGLNPELENCWLERKHNRLASFMLTTVPELTYVPGVGA